MIRIPTLLVFLYFILGSASLMAQKLEKKLMRAESMFFLERFEEARLAYEEILELDSDNKLSKYRVEICSLLTISPQKSTAYIESYSKTQGRKDKFYHYWLAHIYFNQERYKETIDECHLFSTVNKYKTREIRDEVIRLRKVAEARYNYFLQSHQFEITHLEGKLNTPHNEYSPVYYDKGESVLFLSSHRRLGISSKREKLHVFESILHEGKWHTPKTIHHLHSYSRNNTSLSILQKEEKVFVYSDHDEGQIQFSQFHGHTWSTPNPFIDHTVVPELSSHFFINEQGNKILYSAMNTKEKPSLDIYYIVKDGQGKWSTPKSISKLVNTKEDQDYPYLSVDGKSLYFSSKGHGTIGGYDIFKCEWDETESQWKAPEALMNPTNSIGDDIQFSLNDDLVSGYFSSNREGGVGGYDLYYARELYASMVSGVVLDGNGQAVEGASLVFNSTQSPDVFLRSTSNEQGQYKVKGSHGDEMAVEVWVDGERVHRDTLTVPVTPHIHGLVEDYNLDWVREN